MNEPNPADQEGRVLVLAPTGKDGANSRAVLGKAGFACTVCRDINQLCREVEAGVGAVVLTEEALTLDRASCLTELLQRQPAWSDLPVVALTRGGPDSPAALRAMQTLGNVILLERPVRVSTLLTAVRTALRARARQYQSRAHLLQLQEADRRKDEFLAMLAHELRNPLAPIQNALEVFKLRGPADATLRWAREVVDRQVGHLTRLVDDLLDVSRVTRGKVVLKKELCDLAAVLARAVETSRPLIEARAQALTVTLPTEPLMIDGDIVRLGQVVANLLNNAAKYTPVQGHIWLTAGRQGEDATISVRDDGIGIARDMLPKVFDLFTQADSSLDRSQGGLGIGLTLVRSIVELHGGRVQVESAGTGRGSEFTVQLPASASGPPPQAAGRPAAPTTAAPTCRVLVVDDNHDAADSLAMLLRLAGHDVRTAYNGSAALELSASFGPEAVVLDIGLPGMNGYELARRFRTYAAPPLLIALTGYGQEEHRQRAEEAGFDHHLVKPPDLERLQRILRAAARTKSAGS